MDGAFDLVQNQFKRSPFPPETPLTKTTHENFELHQIGESLPVPGSVKGGAPTVGKSSVPAREDHVHPFYDKNGNILFQTNGGATYLNGRVGHFLNASGFNYTTAASPSLGSSATSVLNSNPIAVIPNDYITGFAQANVRATTLTGPCDVYVGIYVYVNGVYNTAAPISGHGVLRNAFDTVCLTCQFDFSCMVTGNLQFQVVGYNMSPANSNAFIEGVTISLKNFMAK